MISCHQTCTLSIPPPETTVFQDFKVHVGCFVHLKTNHTKKTNVSTIHMETTASDFCQEIIGF